LPSVSNWTIHVRGDESRRPTLSAKFARQLAGGRRLTRPLQPDHHHHRGRNRAELEAFAPFAEHCGELVEDDLDQLLRRRDRLELRHADGLLFDPLEKLARELKVDVGLEEDAAHLTQPLLDVGIGEDPAPAQAGESLLQLLAQLVEHSLQT